MKKNLIQIILFLFILIIADRSLSFLISRFNYLLFKDCLLEQPLRNYLEGKKFDTLILGSSRTYEGVHPLLLKSKKFSPFKWSYAGNGPKYNYHFYKLFKKINGTPKIVIYGVDFFIYKLRSSPMELNEIGIRTTDRLLLNITYPNLFIIALKNRYEILLNDIMNSYRTSKFTLEKKIVDIQNYVGSDKAVSTKHKLHTERPATFKKLSFVPPNETESKYFFNLLEELKNDNVKVILLTLPDYIGTHKTLLGHIPFRFHLKKLQRTYKNINILNYNYSKTFDLKDESLFLDGGYGYENSHLSKKGSFILTSKLKKRLNKIFKQN